MASRRLTRTLKDEIEINIRKDVEKVMAKSIPGMELQEMKDTLITSIRECVKKKVNAKDLLVLTKYNKVREIHRIALGEYAGHAMVTWRVDGFLLQFDPALVLPDTPEFNVEKVVYYSLKPEKMNNLFLNAIKIYRHIQCEIEETTTAFMESINSYTTTAKLLTDNPELEKYLPVVAPSIGKSGISKKAKSIIKNFQAA